MTSIFESEVANIIGGALAPHFLDGVLSRDSVSAPTDPFDPSTGTPSTATYTCKALHEEYGVGYKQASLVNSGDRKVMILATSLATEPQPGDRITIRGQTFTIVPANTAGQNAVTTDPAKAVWNCRCRQ